MISNLSEIWVSRKQLLFARFVFELLLLQKKQWPPRTCVEQEITNWRPPG